MVCCRMALIGQIGRNGLTFSGVIKLLNCIPTSVQEMLIVCLSCRRYSMSRYMIRGRGRRRRGSFVGLGPEKMHFNSFPIRINASSNLLWLNNYFQLLQLYMRVI